MQYPSKETGKEFFQKSNFLENSLKFMKKTNLIPLFQEHFPKPARFWKKRKNATIYRNIHNHLQRRQVSLSTDKDS
jgi:hypothetical protein